MRCFVLLLFIALGFVHGRAADIILEAENHLAAGAVAYRDDRASGKKCSAVLLDGERASKELFSAAIEQPPGDYEVTFWLEPAPLDVLHHLRVELEAASTKLVMEQAQFAPGSGYQPMRVRASHRGGAFHIRVRASGASGFDGMRQTMSEEEKATMDAATLQHGAGIKEDDAGLDEFDALDLLEEEKSIANFKFYDLRVLLDRVVVRPLRQPEIMVAQVEVDKIHYRPGETVQATVSFAGKAAEVTLVAHDVSELDDSREVYRQALTAQELPQAVTFSYDAGEIEFGHALRISLLRGDTLVHDAEALYGLNRNVYRMGITGRAGPQDMRKYTVEQARAQMEANKRDYANYFERFAWAPCDYSNLAPETEIFYSGQVQYQGSITGYKNLLNEAHRVGIKGITYGKASAAGIDGFNTFQRFPELFRQRPEGIPSEAFNVFYLERMLDDDYLLHAKSIDGGWQHWASLWTNWSNPRTVTYGAECIIESVKMFGWDGVRWDGHFVGAQQPFIDMLNETYPDFVHGYNIAFANPGADIFLPPARPFEKEDFHTVAQNHGLMMDESARDWSHTNFSSGLIRPFYNALAREADYIKRIGGLPLYITFDMASKQDTTLNVLIGLASGQRYTYLTSPGDFQYGPLPKFLTRYAAFIWDDTASIANAAEHVSVKVGKGPEGHLPWFDRTTWLRSLPDGRQQLLINLFNPPGYPAFSNRVQAPPPLLQDVTVSLKLPAGATLLRAAHLSPDLAEGHQMLEAQVTEAGHSVVLRSLRGWSIVMMELEGAPQPAYTLTTPVEDAEKVLATQAEAQAKKDEEARAQAGIGPGEAKVVNLPAFKDYDRVINVDAEREEKLTRPAELAIFRNGILDVHHARGAFSWHNPVESALGISGGGSFSPSWVDLVGFKLRDTGCMDSFPDTYEALLDYDVLVLDNLHATYLGWKRRTMAADFVRAGGGLLIFGGYCNLSMGADHNSYIAELLPVRIEKFNAMVRNDAGMEIKVADQAFFGDRVDWSRAPIAGAVDTSPLKDGVQVLVTVGGQPAIVAHTYGKGRVITVLMNPHGDLPADALPYWQWPQWPRILSVCLEWLGEGHGEKMAPRAVDKTIDPDKIQPVELLMASIDYDARQFTAKLREAQVNVIDTDSARLLLESIVDNADKIDDIELLGELLPKLERYFDASFAPLGQKLIKAPHPFLRSAGYQILGQAGDRQFTDTLRAGLADVDEKVQRQALIGLARAGAESAVPDIRRYLQQGGSYALLAHIALVRLNVEGALAAALPVYSETLDRRTRLRSGRRSQHDTLYGGTSFKLTPLERRRHLNDYRIIKQVEAELEHDLGFFANSLITLSDAQLQTVVAFLKETENRKVLPLAYAVYGRLDDAEAGAFRSGMSEAQLEQLRWISGN